MATVIGDVLQLVLSGKYLSQLWENVFFYRVEDTPTEGILEGLVTEFEDEVLAPMALVQNLSTLYDQITCKNIFSDDEFVKAPLDTTVGSNSSGEVLPSFVSARMKLVRSNARVRHGRKSLVGMSEGDCNGQEWTSGYFDDLEVLAPKFALELSPGGVDFLKPVIVGRVFVEADPPDIPNSFYRLPTSQAEMSNKWAYVISTLASPIISTQNSRKIGHGA